jgi:hypothetical protein
MRAFAMTASAEVLASPRLRGEVDALGGALARLSAAGEGDSPQANSWMEPLIPTF